MAGTFHRVRAVFLHVALRQDRVAVGTRVWAEDILGAVDVGRVVDVGASLGCYHVVIAVDLVDVRTLGAVEAVFTAGAVFVEGPGVADGVAGHGVERDEADAAVRAPAGHTLRRFLVYDIGLAVFVEEEGGVDAVDVLEEDGIAPVSRRVGGGHVEMPFLQSEVGRDHVEEPVVGVVGYLRGVDATLVEALSEQVWKLRGAVEDIAYVFPVDEVCRMIQGYSREVSERGGDEVIVRAFAADTGIAVPSGDDRIVELGLVLQRAQVVVVVVALVPEFMEYRVAGYGCCTSHHQCRHD